MTTKADVAEVVGIAGAGRFGVALAQVVAASGRAVMLWSQDPQVVKQIAEQHLSPRLPGVELSSHIRITGSAKELAEAARFIVLAVSSATVRERVRILGDHLGGGHVLVHAIGALAGPGDIPISQVLMEETPVLRVGALAGPALWGDLVAGQVSSMVAASDFAEVTAESRRLLGIPPLLRVYRGSDLIGVELAAALSGAYTVAVGMSDGLGIGSGPRAVLITRILAEASRLGRAYGAEERTFTGLAGLGNLLVRIQSAHSRDYRLGRDLAAGRRPDTSDDLSEGARSAMAAVRLAERLSVRIPVLRGLTDVLSGRVSPRQAAAAIADSVAPRE
ncbi:MAG: NAD(P)-binding domain-containing protein [Myxococcota bacterium]